MAADWPALLGIVDWLVNHPRPGIYLRQIDLPGVHSKFIEGHRAVLAELLDLVLPEEVIDQSHSGIGGFCCRYGFLDKPARVRFRVLDSNLRLLPTGAEQDITLTQTTFAALDPPVAKVFITENEINFLAFPEVPEALAIFGAGYGFDNLAASTWLNTKEIYYWGDIDTHGFAILDQLRAYFGRTISLLMDRETLLAHRSFWDMEPRPEIRKLPKLTEEEQALYDDLRRDRLGKRVRLEQEKISFEWLVKTLKSL